MKTNREIQDWLNRCRCGKLELRKHLNTIEQIKLDMMMNNQKVQTLKSVSSSKINPDCQTAESIYEDKRQSSLIQHGNYSDDQDYRVFISKNNYYDTHQIQNQRSIKKPFLQEFSGKQDSDTVDDIFKLSLTDQSLSQQQFYSNKDFYESIKQKQQHGIYNKDEMIYQNHQYSTQNFEDYQEISLKASLCQIDKRIKQIQKEEFQNSCQNENKTFNQYYQEYVTDEISNIQHEIQEMQKFLKRIQTAKDKLTSSVQDLSYQNSQRSMQKLNQDLDIIQTLRNKMQNQLQNNVDGDKLLRLRSMKQQIQECFNDIEEEIIKLSK
ncbi:unnamed protein product (macronuclear) [Paramecium tetraurelia]|uniref:Uncharacterized protein n=1 Tax=Paramecium tetraurelia TaxID=5888 RepID=A0CJQ6_PARTE|nr:uncharacterized protein GSPATT00000735001 [Paramecium tetraurelia]CAK71023.1 unnamed protein product [Paramecium tetraurelia]|eukprot:XP_001438420.1 hypothetical protein (macronuclear) [Paramecium tetraurelia strain d4-2]